MPQGCFSVLWVLWPPRRQPRLQGLWPRDICLSPGRWQPGGTVETPERASPDGAGDGSQSWHPAAPDLGEASLQGSAWTPPLCPGRTGVVASAPQPSPPRSLPLPAAGATGCGSGCERTGGPCGVLQRGFSAPNGDQGHPILGRGHPAPHSGIKGPSSSAEHTQTRDRSTGDGFPPALPLRCFSLSVVFSSFLGALRASLSCLWQRLKIAEEGKETLGFRSGMPR